ncbi:colanic acid biosynthesis pyruvyl transferase WcaK [Serratia plymuthica]|uniref:colanic acid biosynthesis pyruvyl transferase WcaK n=1 Tax=Serratia plymuthica TaxID=82996 RepID=UPI0004563EE2|nr:colanic acid biosynthesis pyruvyl transferase WcaK [Serratia plymuthica]AHY06535.1 colanic acid biosynthesis protein [Serratia plymuthica]ANJ97881.1 colanic acid biosynthesis protein [Serratia plymuthica]UJD98494.1 colanic acid biosynthesis pyruvyl transferase WcaK [Serratia plymuthica]
MKLLLVGNHTCGNRGDGAILRGLIESIEVIDPAIEVTAISRYSVSSSYLLGRKVEDDVLYRYHFKKNGGFKGRVIKALINRYLPALLVSRINNGLLAKILKIPVEFDDYIQKLETYDAVIQVGGSFFVDLYGKNQFEHSLCAILAKKPIYMIGHSVGPFERKNFNEIANLVFSKVKMLALREEISKDLMLKSGITTEKVISGVDTAWLVNNCVRPSNYALEHWSRVINERASVAITMRELAPFDQRLGVTQVEYEIAIGSLIDNLISQGFNVLAVSTCTGIDSYHKDDRMIAIQVGNRLTNKDNYHVVMDEFNDVELGSILSQCQLTIGTRLHSAIISMNFGTPAVAINYEHKSAGIMKQLGLPELSSDVAALIDGSLISKVNAILENIAAVNEKVHAAINNERVKGMVIMKDIIKEVERKN